MSHRNLIGLLLCLMSAGANVANAALIDRGGGLIYDTDLDVTWLQNASVSGPMTWLDAVNWAADYSYYDSVRNQTLTGWRLPTAPQPDTSCPFQDPSGYSYGYCTNSELGHLFYNELGGVSGQSIHTAHNSNYPLFNNPDYPVSNYIQASQHSLGYWSGTSWNEGNALFFNFQYGNQAMTGKTNNLLYAWAVRDGDITPVPLPAAAWFLGGGLGALGLIRRKQANV